MYMDLTALTAVSSSACLLYSHCSKSIVTGSSTGVNTFKCVGIHAENMGRGDFGRCLNYFETSVMGPGITFCRL